MKHNKVKKIIGRPANHRKMLVKNLIISFFENEMIKTTAAKAKYVKPMIEKLVTVGKKDNLTSRRYLIRKTGSNKIATKVLKDISPKFKERKGGYTRIIKLGTRKGDGAPMVYLKFVE